MKTRLLALSLLFAASGVWSQEPAPQAVPDAPPPPPPVASGEPLEPEITIVRTEKGTLRQYRVNGHVYMVEVTPIAGPPYYLLDTNGDGELDSQADDIKNVSVPQWILFSW